MSGAFATTSHQAPPSRSHGAQELPDPVPGAHQIQANVFAAAHQITQLLTLH